MSTDLAATYAITDTGSHRILTYRDRTYTTAYSRTVLELIIQRKGIDRALQYLKYAQDRVVFLQPLFRHLHAAGCANLRVLEVGCSAGHITEYLNAQPCVGEVFTYDVDQTFVDIVRLKRQELGLEKVVRVDAFSNAETLALPYPNRSFDLVIVLAVLEHLPVETRFQYVDGYYQKLKTGGLIGFFDTPNRSFPWERHTVGLPGVQWLPPQWAYVYAKLRRKFRRVSFADFMRYDTGWRNASYAECLPRAVMISVEDISEEIGYGYPFFMRLSRSWRFRAAKPVFLLLRGVSQVLGCPTSFFLQSLNLVFRKTHDFEAENEPSSPA